MLVLCLSRLSCPFWSFLVSCFLLVLIYLVLNITCIRCSVRTIASSIPPVSRPHSSFTAFLCTMICPISPTLSHLLLLPSLATTPPAPPTPHHPVPHPPLPSTTGSHPSSFRLLSPSPSLLPSHLRLSSNSG